MEGAKDGKRTEEEGRGIKFMGGGFCVIDFWGIAADAPVGMSEVGHL